MIVVWLSVLTEHQLETFISLQDCIQSQIHFVVGNKILPARQSQGWNIVKTDNLSLEVLPINGWWNVARKILNHYPDAIHLFGGFWADKRFFPLILFAQSRSITTSVMMEPYPDCPQSYFGVSPGFLDRLKSVLRPVAYSLAGLLVSRRLIAAFPIGKKAISQLQNIGVDNARIFPFGYFVDRLSINPHKNSYSKKSCLKLIFVGSLISRKGLITLFKAIKICHENNVNVSLDVYGPGDPNIFKEIPKNVSFEGSVNFGEAQRVIKEYDVLILPSLHDGWGVVVNEALLQGVPVIVSDAAGASTLVEKSGAGCVFKAGDEKDLADKIRYLVNSPQLIDQWASEATNFKEKISTKIAAQYIYACLQFATGSTKDKPVSPWYT